MKNMGFTHNTVEYQEVHEAKLIKWWLYTPNIKFGLIYSLQQIEVMSLP